jgi:hypothetical protein
MNTKKKKIIFYFILCFIALLSIDTFAFAKEKTKNAKGTYERKITRKINYPKKTIKDILDKVDKLYRSSSSWALVEMKVITANYERPLEMEFYTKGLDETFIYVKKPTKEKGIQTLRIKNQMWNYLPKADKVMLVPPSMMMGSWMGSDFTNDDLVKESTLLDDYLADFFYPEKAKKNLYYIQLTPKEKTISVWDKIELIVDRKTLIPVKETYFDSRSRAMRVLTFAGIKKMGGKTIPTVMEMYPVNKKSNKTVIKYIDAKFDIKIPKNIFTLQNLKKKR